MVIVEKYDCTLLCSDRPSGALTCQSEQEGRGRERQREAENDRKKKDMSFLRNTHTHIC